MGLIDWIAAGPARSARRSWARGTPTRAPMPTCEKCGRTGRPLTVRRGRAVCRTRC